MLRCSYKRKGTTEPTRAMKEHLNRNFDTRQRYVVSLAFRPQTYIYTVLKICITKRYASSYRNHRNTIKIAK